MLRERDYNILRFIEKYNAISLKNACSIFFTGKYKDEEYRYRFAARRLQTLEEKGILQSYRNSYTDLLYKEENLSTFNFYTRLLEKVNRY